jgi:hypothetical protein
MAKRAAILRWTGRGNASDLRSSVQHVLAERGVRARVHVVGGSLVIAGAEPVGVCSIFENMPGVAWAAAGYLVGEGEFAEAASSLAAGYLRPGTRFSVLAEATGGRAPSDLAGTVTSAMLGKVKGARASDGSPKVRFRAALDGTKGVVGVEVSKGPGGTPMGAETAACLVSGGKHSSVLVWNALLLGLRVRMVHASSGERSLYAAAKLYSELSDRADPRGLSLTVLEGGPAPGLLAKYVSRCSEPVFAGFTVGRPPPGALGGKVQSPLFMLPEEAFELQFESMGLKSFDGVTDWAEPEGGGYTSRVFGGKRADVSGVLDGLR